MVFVDVIAMRKIMRLYGLRHRKDMIFLKKDESRIDMKSKI